MARGVGRKRHENPDHLNCRASRCRVGHVAAHAPLDDLTPCSVAVRAFASKDETKIREIGEFVDSIFERLDQEHKNMENPAI